VIDNDDDSLNRYTVITLVFKHINQTNQKVPGYRGSSSRVCITRSERRCSQSRIHSE